MKYEYTCHCYTLRTIDTFGGMSKWLNNMGKQGWKLVTSVKEHSAFWWIFVREI